jgi:vancomycin resistance protein YoaR
MKSVKIAVLLLAGLVVGVFALAAGLFLQFENKFQTRVFPGIFAENADLGGKSQTEIEEYFAAKNEPLAATVVELRFEDQVATLSGDSLEVAYDGKLAARHAMTYGRSNTFSDLVFKLESFIAYSARKDTVIAQVKPVLTYNHELVTETLSLLKDHIDIATIEPQFEFSKDTNRVSTFKLGQSGRALNTDEALKQIESQILENPGKTLSLVLPVDTLEPKTGDKNIDDLGIVELIGKGESYYKGSIPGRVHNVILASSRASGVLVAPGETFSFNDTVGDISAATGYKSAYIIKNGRTELGDGGGVCQVSTTIFRAALNAGLEIVERKPHSYRVAYYEQGGFKPGLDATVFSPTVDLKIKNTTDHHILIQAVPDPTAYHLTYEIYGKKDGRVVEISDIRTLSKSPAPPPLYQEDPTLPSGQIKQVDYAATGAKTTFDYKVTKNGEVLGASTTFNNNYRPWQAVYLYGPGTAVPTPPPPQP